MTTLLSPSPFSTASTTITAPASLNGLAAAASDAVSPAAPAAPTASAATPDRPLAHVVGDRAKAAERIRNQIEAGLEIRDLRIRYPEDLDDARQRKLAWVQQATDLLNKLFDNGSVADYCNDWVGKIFPEYAEFGNFVEQFYEEMTHRIGRLKAVYKRVEVGVEHPPTTGSRLAAAQVNGHASPDATTVPPPSSRGARQPVAAAPAAPAAAVNATTAAHARQPDMIQAPHAGPVTVLLALSSERQEELGEPIIRFLADLGVRAQQLTDADTSDEWTDMIDRAAPGAFALVSLRAGEGPQALAAAAFRLGYCAGKLGPGRLCIAHTAGQPTGLEPTGLPHLSLDATGGWQLQLARQLKRAGLPVDLNKLC